MAEKEPEEKETETETNFAEDLAFEGLLHQGSLDEKKAWADDDQEKEKAAEAEAEAEAAKKADPFDDPEPKKKPQRNWLEHGLTENVSMEKKKRGRPAGSLNKGITKQKATEEAIQIMTAAGVSKTSMAKLLGMSIGKLNRNFKHFMEYGDDILKTRIVSAIVKKALDGNMTAALFYMKAKGGWREADKNDVPDKEALALSDVERNQRLMSLLMTNPQFKIMMGQKLLESQPIDVNKIEEADVFDV